MTFLNLGIKVLHTYTHILVLFNNPLQYNYYVTFDLSYTIEISSCMVVAIGNQIRHTYTP